jgi:ubiquinone/menaquinone biosynthesis C-methylase UbiE
VIVSSKPVNQCKKPTGWLGRFVLRNMNARHSKVTDWGLAHVSVNKSDIVLDVGCGGGKTVQKLAEVTTAGKVYGVDFSPESVKISTKTNRKAIAAGRVEILEGSVSQLPFADGMFNLVTAVETHFWWPDLLGDLREVRRVIKPGGTLVVIAEVYRGAETKISAMVEKYLPMTGMKFLSIDEHRELLANAGYPGVQVSVNAAEGWICCVARR